jgi:hypothetical protein
MSQSQNRNMRNKRRHGNMTPQKSNNHKTEVLVDNEFAEVRRMMIRMFNKLKDEHKEDIKKQLNESQENA